MLKNDPTFPSSVPAPGYKWRGNPHVRCAYRQSWYYKKWNMRHRNCCYYNSRGRAYACGKRTPRGPYCKHIFLRRHRYGRFGFTCGALWLKYYGSNGFSNDWQKRPGQALATTVPIDGKTDSYVFYCQNGRDTKVVHLFTHIDLAGRGVGCREHQVSEHSPAEPAGGLQEIKSVWYPSLTLTRADPASTPCLLWTSFNLYLSSL